MNILLLISFFVHLAIVLVTFRITTIIIEDAYPIIEPYLSSFILPIPYDLLLFALYVILGLMVEQIDSLTRSTIIEITLVIIASIMVSISLVLDRYFERPRLWRFTLIGIVQLTMFGIYFNLQIFYFLAGINASIIIFFTFGQKSEIITRDQSVGDLIHRNYYEQSLNEILRRDDFFGFWIKYNLGYLILLCDKYQLKKTVITVSILIGTIGKIIIEFPVIDGIGYSMIHIGTIMFGAGIGLVLAEVQSI